MLSKGAGSYIAILGSFSPLDLGSTLAAWWDFSDAETLFTDAGTTPVDSDGDAIYQANDKSGNAKHMIQATLAARPLYKTAVHNSLSTARFDGSDDIMSSSLVSSLTDDLAMVIVCKPNGTSQQKVNFINGSGNGYGVAQCVSGSSFKGLLREASGWDASSEAPDTNLQQMTLVRMSGAWNLYTDGGTDLLSSSTAPMTPTTATRLGGARVSATWYASVDICEAMFLAGPNTEQLNQVGAYLAAKWGLTWSAIS